MSDEHIVSLQPGTVIGGRYEVVKCLGAGSMGLVYSCRHRELSGHLVAVKVLFPEVAQDKVAAARFRNEIFASYGVSHPNVVRAYEYIRDGDLVAYTMEYVSGGDLADRIGGDQPLTIPEIVRFLSQMCSGVQAIHDAGIIHRDLKPENILLSKDGNVKIADFGIARTGHGPKLTEHGGVVGTIDYVSPEYMLNSQVDWRSDIYAIGILAYEMVTGESPFRGDSVYATMTKRLKSDPVPPSKLRHECPAALDQVILRAMARNPDERYQSAADMETDLRALMGAAAAPQLNGAPASAKVPAAPQSGTVMRAPSQSASPSGARRPSPGQMGAPGRGPVDAVPPVGRNSPESMRASLLTSETQVVNAEVMRQVQDRYEGSPQPKAQANRLESVLNKPSWNKGGNVREVRIGGGNLDEQRMQRLAHLAAQNSRSVWLDMVTIILAVLIGIGIGCIILKVWFPDLLRSRIGLFDIGVDDQ